MQPCQWVNRMQNLDDSSFRDELVELIYGSLLDDGNWQRFLDRLNSALHNGKTTFLFYDSVARQGYFSLKSGYTEDEVAVYNAHYNTVNPWMPKASVRPVGIGVTSDQMYSPEQLRKTEFYNDYLRKSELEGGAGLTIFRDRGRSFVVTTLMSERDRESRGTLANLFTDLSADLARAFSYYRKSAKESDASRSQSQLLDLAGIGLLIVDEDARLKTVNEAGEALIDRHCGIRVAPNGRVVFAQSSLQEVLKAACRRLSTGAVRRSELDASGGRFEITIVRMQSDTMREFLAGPFVAILLKPLSTSQLLATYALSAREAEVAKAIIAGKSIQQIAEERGLSRETVRTQLKSVFAKLGVDSQADLVRKFSEH
ncbi:hypothetical protein GOB15_07075 [Sinorhizobium meliloti]|nr:hypothetical protein [Sinorhizobium meliloti]MDW9509463.1 hypothetical protein [Sinorhizobium meliloti]